MSGPRAFGSMKLTMKAKLVLLAGVGFLTAYSAWAVHSGPPERDTQPECAPSDGLPTQPQQDAIRALMSAPSEREHHFRWHSSRGMWSSLTNPEQSSFAKQDPAVVPPRVLGPPPHLGDPESCRDPRYNPMLNGAGEDFLYMHHGMIRDLNAQLKAQGLACVGGWKTLPARDDIYKPAPKTRYYDNGIELAELQGWQKDFLDESKKGYLAGKTLSEVGYALEMTLHNNLHVYYARLGPGIPKPPEYPPNLDLLGSLPEGSPYNSPQNDFLGSTYSAHVNPVFWKLHGLVDQVIYAWLHANGFEEIALDCQGRARCYAWKGTWDGRPAKMHSKMLAQVKAQANAMKAVAGGHPPRKLPLATDTFKARLERIRAIQRTARALPKAGAGPKGPGQQADPNDPLELVRRSFEQDEVLASCIGPKAPVSEGKKLSAPAR